MKTISLGKARNLRKERNADLIQRMRNGDQLSSFNSYSSWFPPRPIIEKDRRSVERLYGTEPMKIRHVSVVNDQARADQQRRSDDVHPLRLA
jgi:hypothetical protein